MSTKTLEAISKQMEEEDKLKEEAGLKAAANQEKMGELGIAAERQHQALLDSARRVSVQQRMAEEEHFATEAFNNKMREFAQDVAALDKGGKDYANKLKAIQDKEKQLITQHENEVTAIKEKAEEERNRRIKAAEDHARDATAQGLTQSIMGHETWAKMVTSLGDQVVSGMIKNAIMSMLADDMTKEKDAAAAARMGFMSGMKFPFPANLVMAPVLGAAAFTSVMAFQGGTDSVPGTGHGDKIPAMLEPGEGVVPGGVMDNLRKQARDGSNQRPQYTVHVRPVYHVNTIDGDGMQATLEKHTDQLQRHFENSVRRMNH